MAVAAPAATVPPAQADTEQTVTLVDQDSAGNATLRFDVNGEAIDAHDGQIQRFGDTYYLYRTAYDCGYEWNTPGAPFCGFVSYSSPDLVHWTPRGPLFDATTATWQQRCDGSAYGWYRPHVVYNASTGRYVLWINTYDVGVRYRVFTSTRPDGGFTETAVPDLAAPEGPAGSVNYGDQQVFVDDDGVAYPAFTDWTAGGDLLVERLDSAYTSGTGDWTRVNVRSTEAPTIFERKRRLLPDLLRPQPRLQHHWHGLRHGDQPPRPLDGHRLLPGLVVGGGRAAAHRRRRRRPEPCRSGLVGLHLRRHHPHPSAPCPATTPRWGWWCGPRAPVATSG